MSGFITSANIFAIIFIKDHKVDFLCLYKNVSGFIASANIFAIILIKGRSKS